jgi:hypothetical protein
MAVRVREDLLETALTLKYSRVLSTEKAFHINKPSTAYKKNSMV